MDADDPVLTALAEQHAELDAMVAGLTEDEWAAPSRCDGWSVSDVVLHLAQTDDMARASLEGRYSELVAAMYADLPPVTDLDQGVDVLVQHERGASGTEVFERWRSGAARLRSAFESVEAGARVEWVVGTLAARTLATTRLAECWIHTGDVAGGLGVPHPATDRLWHIVRLAWRTLPHAFAREGKELSAPVALRLTAPSGEAWDFGDGDAPTVVTGDAVDLCLVAARRVPASATGLTATGPEADAVLASIRTWA